MKTLISTKQIILEEAAIRFISHSYKNKTCYPVNRQTVAILLAHL